MNQILLMLGLNANGFSAGLKRARDETSEFERGWKGLAKVFAAGGITTLALGFLQRVVQHARESKDALDENTQAVIRFGNSWDQAKSTFMNGAVQALGWIADKVEKGAIAFGGLVYGIDAAADALDRIEEAPGLAAAAAAAEKLSKAESDLAKGRRDRAMAEADGYGKLVILINEEVALKQKVRALDNDKPAQLKAINDLEAKSAEVKKVALSITKDEAEATKKIGEERQRIEEERRKVVEDNREMMILEAKFLSGSINPEEQKRLEILRLQAKQKAINAELDELLAKKLAGTITPAETARLNVLIKQADVIQGQIDGLSQVNAEIAAAAPLIDSNIAKWREFAGLISSTGRGDRELSDRELERKIQNIKNDIAAMQVANPFSPSFFLSPQKSNLAQAEAEQRLRDTTRRNVNAFGEDRAFAMSGLTEQRFSEIMTGQRDEQRRLNTNLNELNRNVQSLGEQVKFLGSRN